MLVKIHVVLDIGTVTKSKSILLAKNDAGKELGRKEFSGITLNQNLAVEYQRSINLKHVYNVLCEIKEDKRANTDVIVGINSKQVCKDINSLDLTIPTPRCKVFEELLDILSITDSFKSFRIVNVKG